MSKEDDILYHTKVILNEMRDLQKNSEKLLKQQQELSSQAKKLTEAMQKAIEKLNQLQKSPLAPSSLSQNPSQ